MQTLEIVLNDGGTVKVEVDSYSAAEIETKMNSREVYMVAIGDVVVNKSMIKLIAPVASAE